MKSYAQRLQEYSGAGGLLWPDPDPDRRRYLQAADEFPALIDLRTPILLARLRKPGRHREGDARQEGDRVLEPPVPRPGVPTPPGASAQRHLPGARVPLERCRPPTTPYPDACPTSRGPARDPGLGAGDPGGPL